MNSSSTFERRPRVFISYKRNVAPDETLALQLYAALRHDFDPFIDQEGIDLGTNWARRIDSELHLADYFICLLSEAAVQSEMVVGEIEKAFKLSKERGGECRPVILPVRLAYEKELTYPLNAYLNHINYAFWASHNDTPQLIEDVHRGIRKNEFQPPPDQPSLDSRHSTDSSLSPPFPIAQLEMPEGTMDLQSEFYIKRLSDDVALSAIQRQGVTITIKGPRQVGKSSLLIRIKDAAERRGKKVVFLDLQQIDKATLKSADILLRQFCTLISYKLKLQDRVNDFWSVPLGESMRCSLYMEEYVLEQLNGLLVLAMDEVDALFDSEFRSDFFGMLRSWHNSRADTPAWKRLDLVLVTSTEPYQFIDDLNQSPFNVGEKVEPEDFTPTQVADLVERHGLPHSLTTSLLNLVGGHPYLIRRALYLIAAGRITANDLFSQAASERGPFSDHLHYHLFRLNDRPRLIRGLLQVIRSNKCEEEEVSYRLQSAGLVLRETRHKVVPRCQLYSSYFQEHLRD